MSETKIFPAFCFVLLITLSNSFAAGVELYGIGARANAMAGAYRAVADDWSAMYWNPAGLAFTKGYSSGLNIAFIMPRATFHIGDSHYFNTFGDSELRNFSVAYQDARSDEPLNFTVPAGGLSFSTGKWACGFGVWAPMGWGSKWDLFQTDDYNSAYPQYEFESDIQVIDIHPTVAYKVNDKLSLGFGVSFLVGKVNIRQPAFLQNPYLYDQSLYRTLSSITNTDDLSVLDEMRRPPYDHLINQVEMASKGNGYGVNLGVMYKPAASLSIGLSMQYFTDLKISGPYKQTTYFANEPDYQNLAQSYTDAVFTKLHEAGLIDDLQYSVMSGFYSGAVTPRVDTNANAHIPIPLKIGLGVSYAGVTNWLFAANMDFTQWSKWDVIRINEKNGNQVSQLAWNWNDTFKLGFGFEYDMGRAIVRGGFATESRAASDGAVLPSIPDIGRRNTLTLGLSLPLGRYALAVNYEKILIADRKIVDWKYDQLTVTQNLAGDYTMNVNNLMVGIDYIF